MKSLGSLSRHDVELIQNEPTTDDKAEKLLDILCKKPNNAYSKFLVCLYNVHQDLYSRVRAIQEQKVQSKINRLRLIADVALTKRHQWLHGQNQDYFYPHCIQKLFSKKSVMQYTPAIHCSHSICLRACYKNARFTQLTFVRNVYVAERKTTLLIPV